MASAKQIGKRVEDAGEPCAIPLDLAPLLAPHKKHGRVSIRVERLPQQARLSRGTRNSDGSWSLTRDELEDLQLLVPEGSGAAHKLSVRIISLAGGNTLALVDLPVVPGEAEAVPRADEPKPASTPARAAQGPAVAADDAQTRRLLDELGALKIILATRESELAEVKQQAGAAAPATGAKDAERDVAAAREAWQREAQIAIAKAEASWKEGEAARLAAAEAAWRAQAKPALSHPRAESSRAAELKDLREKLAALQAERDGALQQAQAGKEGEAARLAAAEAEWRARSEQAAVGVREDPARAAELKGIREKLAALQTERDGVLASAREALEQMRALKDGEAARLAAAEAAWRAQSEQALAAAQSGPARATELKSLHDKLTTLQGTLAERDQALASAREALEQARASKDGEAGRLVAAEAAKDRGAAELRDAQAKLAALQTTLGERDAALGEVRATLEQARVRALRETQDALAKAERAWKDAEAERLEAAEAAWRAQSSHVAAAGTDQDAALRTLREQLTTLQGTLRQRERALAAADKSFEQAREQWQRELHEAIVKAEKDFRAKEASRRTTTETQVRKENAGSLAHATARYEAAEAALAQIRVKSPQGNARMEQELLALRASLDVREDELAQARATITHLREDAAPAAAPDNRRLIRDALVAACVGVVAAALYTFVEPLVFARPTPEPAPVVAAVTAPAPAAVPALPVGSVTRDAKLRAEPSSSADVIAMVAKGREVFIVEKREKWVRVQVEGGKPVEGWMRDTSLKEQAPAPVAR
jgi:hypothetical protein